MSKKITKNKKFLFLVATHGDEDFSLPVVKKLKGKFKNRFDYIVGNPKALKAGKRFTKVDLNRVAPGSRNSKIYEEKRANEIIQKSKNYEFIIDIHGTIASPGIFTIVTNPTPANIYLAYSLPIQKIVIWGSKNNGRKTGPLSRFVNCGVGIECGPKNSNGIKQKLYLELEEFLKNRNHLNTFDISDKEVYQVFGSLDVLNGKGKSLREFQETTINNQKFFPLLINQYRNENILCYKLKKVDLCKTLNLPY